MKVLYISNIPVPYRVEFFNELGKYCELTVIFERRNAQNRNQEWLKNDIKNFNAIFLNGINLGIETSFNFKIIKYLNKKLFDVFIIGGYSTPVAMLAIEYLNFKKIKFILNADGGFIKKDSKVSKNIKKHFISSAKYWLSTGEKTSQYLKYYGANEKNIYKYNFSSLKKCEILEKPLNNEIKSNMKKELNFENVNKIVIFVGQLVKRKGCDVLIKAWEKIDNKKNLLLIIGDGVESNNLKNLSKELNILNLKFISFKQKKELEKYYKCADLLVLPTREDIWGLVVNEAMAKGIPVISTNKCLSALELIDKQFIVNVDSELELAKSMNNLLNNEEISCELHYKNLNKIKDYNIEEMSIQHIEIIHKFINDFKQ